MAILRICYSNSRAKSHPLAEKLGNEMEARLVTRADLENRSRMKVQRETWSGKRKSSLAKLMYLFELLWRKPRKSLKIQSVLFVLVDRQALGERIAELKIGGDLTKVDVSGQPIMLVVGYSLM